MSRACVICERAAYPSEEVQRNKRKNQRGQVLKRDRKTTAYRDLGQLQRLPHKFKPTQGDSELVAADRNRTIRTLRYVRVS